MDEQREIYSKLNELYKLIEDHSKGRTIKPSKETKSKHNQKKDIDFDEFSAILTGEEEELPDTRHDVNKKQLKRMLISKLTNKNKTPQQNKTSKQSKNQPKVSQKSSKHVPKSKNKNDDDEIEINDLSIHRDKLQKISNQLKTLDSQIEASLSPKSVKSQTPNFKSRVKHQNNSSLDLLDHSSNNKSSGLQKQTGSSRHSQVNNSSPSMNSTNESFEILIQLEEEEEEQIDEPIKEPPKTKSSVSQPLSENEISSQVFVIEEATQTQLSVSPPHSNSYASSKNSSNSPHLVDIDMNLRDRNINLDEMNKTPLHENNKNVEEKFDLNNQEQPNEEEIVFETIQSRSAKFKEEEDIHNSEESTYSRSTEDNTPNINQASSSSSSEFSIEAIGSNSSDDNAGQIVQSPKKTKVKREPEFLEPIISSSDPDLEKKKQTSKQRPPQIKVPDTSIPLVNHPNNDDNDDIIENEDIIQILETSSSDSKTLKTPNVILSSPTPRSAKTPETMIPIFSSGSESKHTTDNEKEEQFQNRERPVPIYSSIVQEDKKEKTKYQTFQEMNKKINDEILLNNIQSTESSDSFRGEKELSTSSNEDNNDGDLPLLRSTSTSSSEANDY